MSKHRISAVHPTPDQIALAIAAASRITGADPFAVARGDLDPKGSDVVGVPMDRRHMISHARQYAAFALREVVEGANMTVIARSVGVKAASAQSYFSAKDQGGGTSMPWFNIADYLVIVECVRGGPMPDGSVWVKPPTPEPKEIKAIEPKRKSLGSERVKWSTPSPILRSTDPDDVKAAYVRGREAVPSVEPKADSVKSKPAAVKPEPVPVRPAVAYQPPLEIEDDDADPRDRPVFDKGRAAAPRESEWRRPAQMTKAEMAADLERALANTARMQKQED